MAFKIKRNDRRPRFRVQLTANGVPVDLTNADSVRFLMKTKTTLKVDESADFVNKPEGIVEYTWQEGDTDTSGAYRVEIEVTWDDGAPQTFPSGGYFIVAVIDDLG